MKTAQKRIRVLWLIKGLGPGGAERLLVSLAQVRRHEHVDVEVGYVLKWKHTFVSDLEAEGVPVHCLGADSVTDWTWLRHLLHLLKARRYDAIHIHSPAVAAPARILARLAVPPPRPSIYYTEHNVWPSYGWPTRYGNALTYQLDTAQVAVSKKVHDSVPPILRRRLRTVIHGVPRRDVEAAIAESRKVRAELGVGPDSTLICTVANLRGNKAYPDLMAAAKTVIDTGLAVQFVAVGQGPLEEELHELHSDIGLGDRFRFLGYRDDALAVTAASDVFALSSIYEGFPIAVMEALTVGTPVVATAVGGVPDALEGGPEVILVPPKDPRALADALVEIVTNKAFSRAALERREYHLTRYNIRRAWDAYEHMYVCGQL